MTAFRVNNHLQRVLYHHRTQGKAVEGVHIRGITDALREGSVVVDVMSLPGADPYSSDPGMSPTKQKTPLMKLVSKFPEPLFELAELGYNFVILCRVLWYIIGNRNRSLIYERYSLFTFMTTLLARLTRTPIILEINDSATVERVRPLYFRKFAIMLERWTFRRANGLVFVSTCFRDRLTAAHGWIAPSIITPNAANIDKFSFSDDDRTQTRKQFGLGEATVCGYLGAFVPWHNIDQFVFAIADRLKQMPQLKLMLVGDGATFESVRCFVTEQSLQDQIILTGRVGHDEVPGLLAAMDVAILPSAGDYTSPVKLFEFMACAIPPLAPDLDPIQEIIRPGKTGWMFETGDLNDAVEKLFDLVQDKNALMKVGTAAREYIAAERQWVHNIIQLTEFHSDLLAASHPSLKDAEPVAV
jgi:glycosyltransferase involved in cell wall biosynthesis